MPSEFLFEKILSSIGSGKLSLECFRLDNRVPVLKKNLASVFLSSFVPFHSLRYIPLLFPSRCYFSAQLSRPEVVMIPVLSSHAPSFASRPSLAPLPGVSPHITSCKCHVSAEEHSFALVRGSGALAQPSLPVFCSPKPEPHCPDFKSQSLREGQSMAPAALPSLLHPTLYYDSICGCLSTFIANWRACAHGPENTVFM